MRAEAPSIDFPPPDCPICSGALDWDGVKYYCQFCQCTWNADGTHYRWDNPDAEQCTREYTSPFLGDRVTWQCVYERGHAADCECAVRKDSD